MTIKELNQRQWTPYRDDLLEKLKGELQPSKIVRKSDGLLSIRGADMVIDFNIERLELFVVNRERGGTGRISLDKLKRIDSILFWWAIDNGFHQGEVMAR
jgi:hypothetical protein